MLQIMGWLGCLYLIVKGLEILSNKSHRNEAGGLTGAATLAVLAAFGGAVVFFFLLSAQASNMPSAFPPS